MCAWPQMYSRTVRTPEVTHCQSLPCAVRLYLPPSQSASELQLCLPGSCCTQEIRGSVYVHSCGMWMWRNKFISAMKTIWQSEDGVCCDILQHTEPAIRHLHNYPIMETVLEWETISVCFTIYGSLKVGGENREEEEEIREQERRETSTYLWTLSHFLTFSYDVVCHHHEGRRSLRFKRSDVLFYFVLFFNAILMP